MVPGTFPPRKNTSASGVARIDVEANYLSVRVARVGIEGNYPGVGVAQVGVEANYRAPSNRMPGAGQHVTGRPVIPP